MTRRERERWITVGEKLRELDPHRYLKVLEVAEEMVDAHENPEGPPLSRSTTAEAN